MNSFRDDLPHVVIVGAGFAGLTCAKALGGHSVRVTVVDRNNYHLFVPLLYQVATAALSPADIAEPIRKILSRHQNIDVVMGEAAGIDAAERRLKLSDGCFIPYDRLVIATGSAYNYFGHDEWERYAPGLKTLADAREIRARILTGFEKAEITGDKQAQRALMTAVVVGGGPTGVEMAGAIAELARWSLRRDFRNIDPATAQVILVEAGPRILASFPERLAAYARRRLEKLGVTVLTGQAVQDVRPGTVLVGGKLIHANTVVWGAGIRASPAADWLGLEGDRLGRVPVAPDLSVIGLSGVYALGDTALAADEKGAPLPALAQVAAQQGDHLGTALAANLERGALMPPFRFRNRGNTAVVGRSAAIFDFGKHQIKGWWAWVLWAIVHVYLLVSFEKRLLVSMQWFWRWLTYQSGARLIMRDVEPALPLQERSPAGLPRNVDARHIPASSVRRGSPWRRR
jgi:NADH dehydrogenase